MSEKLTENVAAMLYDVATVLDKVDREKVRRLIELMMESPVIFMAGMGRSGLLLRCAAMRVMQMGRPIHFVYDILSPAINPGNLLLIASGSGETASLINAAKKARELQATIALITANPSSTIAGMADLVVPIYASTPKAKTAVLPSPRHPMGSLYEESMFMLMEAVILELMQRSGITAADMFKRHANLE